MKRFVSKKAKRSTILILIIAIIIVLTIIISIAKVWFQISLRHREKTFLKIEMARLKEEEAYLKIEVDKFQDPDYVARYAREKYLYSKDGEFTIKIP